TPPPEPGTPLRRNWPQSTTPPRRPARNVHLAVAELSPPVRSLTHMEIKDTAALVTGGASGLGAAAARAFADRGARVFALDLPSAIASAIEKAGAAPDGIEYVATDVPSAEQVEAAVATAVDSGSPLRITVNCAGVGWAGRIVGKQGPHDLDLFRKVIDINLVG